MKVLQNGTKVSIRWMKKRVGRGTIIDHNIEKEDNKKHIFYKVRLKLTPLDMMLGNEPKSRWFGDCEVISRLKES